MHYYTIELRNADGWDAGIPGTGGIMLHEVKLNPVHQLLPVLPPARAHRGPQPAHVFRQGRCDYHSQLIDPATTKPKSPSQVTSRFGPSTDPPLV